MLLYDIYGTLNALVAHLALGLVGYFFRLL